VRQEIDLGRDLNEAMLSIFGEREDKDLNFLTIPDRKNSMKKIRLSFAILITIFLIACIEVREEIKIKLDGSGEMKVYYRVSKMLYTNIEKGEFASVYPLTPRDIERAASKNPYIKLKKVSAETKGRDVYITTVLSFDRFDALTQPGSVYKLTEGDDYVEATIKIRVQPRRKKDEKELQQQITEMMVKNLEAYRNRITIRTPTQIIDSNADYWEKREARWEIPSSIFYTGADQDIVLWVRYRKNPSLWERVRDIFR